MWQLKTFKKSPNTCLYFELFNNSLEYTLGSAGTGVQDKLTDISRNKSRLTSLKDQFTQKEPFGHYLHNSNPNRHVCRVKFRSSFLELYSKNESFDIQDWKQMQKNILYRDKR